MNETKMDEENITTNYTDEFADLINQISTKS